MSGPVRACVLSVVEKGVFLPVPWYWDAGFRQNISTYLREMGFGLLLAVAAPSLQSQVLAATWHAHARGTHLHASRACVRLGVWPPILETESFHDAVQGFDGLTVVKFFAPWCRTCKAVAPAYERFASQAENDAPGRIQFFQVNFKLNKELCLGERVYQLPTVHFYTKGLGRVNRFVLTSQTATARLTTQVERFLGASGHLELLQSLRASALSPLVQYVDLVNVMTALADAPKYLEKADDATMVASALGGPQNREKLERLFERLDTNANGVLDSDELEAIVRAVGGEELAIGARPSLRAVNLQLDKESFVRLLSAKAVADFDKPDQALLPAFEALDVDGDGVLTRDEVLKAMLRLPGGEELVRESEQAFDALDVDKSGTLDYEEFVTMMSGGRFEDAY